MPGHGDQAGVMDANGICLPSDLLLDILRRLPGRALAVSRCVCRAWRDLVGAHTHTLLLPQVFPRKFPGVFAHYYGYDPDLALFGPPASSDARQPGYRRLLLDCWYLQVKHHCNGLLLVTGKLSSPPYVCNPATSRYAGLPCPPTPWPCSVEGMFLAFDPTVSRHHQVFFFPTDKIQRHEEEEQHRPTSSHANLPCWDDWEHTSLPSLFGEEEQHDSQSESEQVQAAEATKEKVFHVFVFSSDTGQWESREFTLGRCASGDLYDVVTAPRFRDQLTWWSAEYWRGSLYVHCHSGVLMVLRCSEGTYDMVQLPGHPHEDERLSQWALPKSYLGSYNGGIRYAVISELQLEVHHLTELTGDPLGWTLAYKADLKEHDRTVNYMRRQERMEPKMRWSVVESSKDLITLFEDNNEESNADCDDGNGKEGEEEEEGMDEQEEEEAQQEEDSDEEKAGDQHAQLESSDGSDYSWNSDEHNFIEFDKSEIADEHVWGWGCNIVGFHPYKDAILIEFSGRVVVYHLHTSRMQYLGDIYPRQHHQQARDVQTAFPYRPCYVDALPPRKTSTSSLK